MLHFIGIVLIFLPISLFGYYLSISIRNKAEFWDEMILLNKNIEIEITYNNKDIFSISEQFSQNKMYDKLQFLKKFQSLKNDYAFDSIQNLISSDITNIDEIKTLTDYFYKIGKSDIENQIKHLTMYENIFYEYKNNYLKIYNEKSRVYKSVSVFFGLGLAILFI